MFSERWEKFKRHPNHKMKAHGVLGLRPSLWTRTWYYIHHNEMLHSISTLINDKIVNEVVAKLI